MKKIFLLVLLLGGLFVVTNQSQAFSGIQFAGKIISNKAIRIQVLEAAGYECPVFGTSIEILPMGKRGLQPTAYLIPIGVYSKTGHPIATNQIIMGRYTYQTTVVCVHPSGDVQKVQLETIPLFGNSAR